ncbi:hypothetical protein NP493_11g04015 [Ridgeia piscesae]|uniref:Adenosine deaminase domain-containing protein n=1 Tax=Ridgeia piscesae TaxID=27915 RepID=A0AAD9PFI0_RIDPI|nr:hypothetical protein NP493_11g04015 [Ridgeia piscesae]
MAVQYRVLLLSLPLLQIVCLDLGFPANEYEYSVKRDSLREKEKQFAGESLAMSEDEQIADRYLQLLKRQEFKATRKTGFPPSRPLEETLDTIVHSDVYRVLKMLPKGGLLHSHENHQLSRSILVDIVWNCSDFQHLYILPENHPTDPWTLDFFISPPPGEGWEKVKGHPNYTKEVILQRQTLLGVLTERARRYPSDAAERWRQMDPLWRRSASQLIANVVVKRLYLAAMWREVLTDGVQYIETRKNLGPGTHQLYSLDTHRKYEPTYGKHYLDPSGELDINMTQLLLREFQKRRPDFIGFRRITYGHHQESVSQMKAKMHLSSCTTRRRAAETNWPDDLMTSFEPEVDISTTQDNSLDAVLLGVSRVGHGLGFIKRPYLLKLLKQRRVAIETCPTSNHLLGYIPDLRNHPAVHYIRSGIPVVLASDDPGSFGYDHVTVDWYQAFMAWGLRLADLKLLALNSLRHSGMSASKYVLPSI